MADLAQMAEAFRAADQTPAPQTRRRRDRMDGAALMQHYFAARPRSASTYDLLRDDRNDAPSTSDLPGKPNANPLRSTWQRTAGALVCVPAGAVLILCPVYRPGLLDKTTLAFFGPLFAILGIVLAVG